MSAQPVPGWPVAFRGSSAVAAGVVTAKTLRGPLSQPPGSAALDTRCGRARGPPLTAALLRVFTDTYVRRGAEPPDLRLRSLAAYRYVEGRGVLSGHSAALLLGADCAAPDAPAEVTMPGGGQREHPGLRVHRGALPAGEIVPCRGALVTSPVRTAYDPGRQPDLVDAVVGIDALANARRSTAPTCSRSPVVIRADAGRGACAAPSPWPTGVRGRRWRPASG